MKARVVNDEVSVIYEWPKPEQPPTGGLSRFLFDLEQDHDGLSVKRCYLMVGGAIDIEPGAQPSPSAEWVSPAWITAQKESEKSKPKPSPSSTAGPSSSDATLQAGLFQTGGRGKRGRDRG